MTRLEIVTLAGGNQVSLAALRLVWELEDRGLALRLDGPDLIVTPSEAVTSADVEALRTWKQDVKTIVAYVETVQ